MRIPFARIERAVSRIENVKPSFGSNCFIAKMLCDNFFGATFQGGRHARRVDMIKEIENEYNK